MLNSSSYFNRLGIFHTILLANGQPCASASQCEGGFCCSSACRGTACPSGGDSVSASSTGSSSSGGGGGGGLPSSQKAVSPNFGLSPDTLRFSLALGEENTSLLILSNTGTATLAGDISIIGAEEFLTVSPTAIEDLPPDGNLTISLDALGRRIGSYFGQVMASANGITREADVVIDVGSAQALFDVKMDIPPALRTLGPNDALRAQITILNVGPPQQVDVFMTYLIKDTRGRVMGEESETFAVFGGKSFVHQFQLPQLEPGKYLAAIEVRYGNSFAVSSDTFTITEEKESAVVQLAGRKPAFFMALIVLAGILFAAAWYLLPKKAPRKKKR